MRKLPKTLALTLAGAIVFGSVVVTRSVIAQRGERLRKILFERQSSRQQTDSSLREILVGRTRRSYILHVPPGYDKRQKLPLVLAFHGGGGNASNMARMSGFNQKADDEKFIVVYPNGSGPLEDVLLTWNAGGCCSYAMENEVDDVAFARALIEQLNAEQPIDEKRIYATGFSNGAMMSLRLGADLSDKLAAIASVAGAVFESSKAPKGRLPVLILHGTADTAVPVEGGNSQRRQIKRAQSEPYKSVNYAATLWARNNGCEAKPLRKQTGAIIRETYTGCAANNDVEVYLIEGGAHAWPGGQRGRTEADVPSTELSATDLIWDFFKAHKQR